MHGTAGVLNGRAGKISSVQAIFCDHKDRGRRTKEQATDRYPTAILESRSKAWDNVDKRKHEVLRVYTAAKNFSDIVVIGRLDSMLKNGREVGFEFVARVVFDRETNDDPKASLYQVWAVSPMQSVNPVDANIRGLKDSAPMARAMAG